jgi:hypothetical protein
VEVNESQRVREGGRKKRRESKGVCERDASQVKRKRESKKEDEGKGEPVRESGRVCVCVTCGRT